MALGTRYSTVPGARPRQLERSRPLLPAKERIKAAFESHGHTSSLSKAPLQVWTCPKVHGKCCTVRLFSAQIASDKTGLRSLNTFGRFSKRSQHHLAPNESFGLKPALKLHNVHRCLSSEQLIHQHSAQQHKFLLQYFIKRSLVPTHTHTLGHTGEPDKFFKIL